MKERFVTSPWFPVTLGILGLIVGYTMVASQAETPNFCPLKHAALMEQM